jgi:hypothetical protein
MRVQAMTKKQAAEREGSSPLTENASLTPHPGDHVPLPVFAIRLQYRGIERTAELPLAPHTIEELVMEAAVRGVTIGELIAELITAMLSKGLDPQVLDNTDPATESNGRPRGT